MNATRNALALGVRRGWTEFVLSLRSPQDQGFYLFMGLGTLVYLWVNRDEEIDGTGISLVAYSLPGILAALLAFGVVIGPAFSLAMEREDGTLLRHKALPHGMQGYVTGQVVLHSLGLLPLLLVILVPSFLLFDGVMERGAAGWLTVTWVLALGLLATLPLGMVIGSLVPSTQKVTTWGMLPVIVVTAISGIFFPVQALWGWVQAIAQVFPTYWIGLGMRSAFLPDAAAAVELGDSWRTGTTVLVLAAWAVAGLLLTPRVLRRMARRQSGSQVAAARDAAAQWVR
ncbi:ABC transporter permease [Geodermatophilus normandii]|uniref:ABC transporter permease n=1 Tax=Geodermatophilus normandii TaxID=1137989 RepID=A0A6P0GN59_9ACTN|nr:ABC transporter permease [Geodermatophilus normandii]